MEQIIRGLCTFFKKVLDKANSTNPPDTKLKSFMGPANAGRLFKLLKNGPLKGQLPIDDNSLNNCVSLYKEVKQELNNQKKFNDFTNESLSFTVQTTPYTVTITDIEQWLINYSSKPLINIDNDQLREDNLIVSFLHQSSNTVYKMYIFRIANSKNNEERNILVITKNNTTIFQKAILGDNNLQSRLNDLYKEGEHTVAVDIKKDHSNENFASKFQKIINNNYSYYSDNDITIKTDDVYKDWGTGISQNTNIGKEITFQIKMYYSYFDQMKKLLKICVDAKTNKDSSLKSFKLLQLNRPKINQSRLLRKLVKYASTIEDFQNPLQELFSRINITRPITKIVGYYNPKLNNQNGTIDEASITSTDCLGALLSFEDLIIAVPQQALSGLIILLREFDRISDDISRLNIFSSTQKFSWQILKNIITNNPLANSIKTLKNVLTQDETNRLNNYNDDMTNFILNYRLDKTFAFSLRGTKEALLAIIQKRIPIIKIFPQSEIIRADTHIRQYTRSQYTYVFDKVKGRQLKEYNRINDSNNPTPMGITQSKPEETEMAVELTVYEMTDNNVSQFYNDLSNWFNQEENKQHINNINEVETTINSLIMRKD